MKRLWHSRKAICFYSLLLLGGWLLSGVLKDLTIPEMRPLNEPMIHRIVITALVAFVLFAAIPFVPGAEIGFALLLLFGAQIAPLVYLGMIGALMLSYLIARFLPSTVLAHFLEWLGMKKAAALINEMDGVDPTDRLVKLQLIFPSKLGRKLLHHKNILLAVTLNTPGNSLLGGGGGLAFIAGVSGLYSFWSFLLIICCAVAPIPLLFYFA